MKHNLCFTLKSSSSSNRRQIAVPIFLILSHNLTLQCAQNRCLATGALAAASLSHVHRKTKTLPVGDGLKLLACQFSRRPGLAGHLFFVPRRPKNIRQTLSTKFEASIAPIYGNTVAVTETRFRGWASASWSWLFPAAGAPIFRNRQKGAMHWPMNICT